MQVKGSQIVKYKTDLHQVRVLRSSYSAGMVCSNYVFALQWQEIK